MPLTGEAERARASGPGVLERTLATTFAPGTNRRGEVLGAAWTLLLPALELREVVCLGVPGPRTLATLARRASRVTVLSAGRGERRRARRLIARAGLANVEVVAAADAAGIAAVDLALVAGRSGARYAERLAALPAQGWSLFADVGRGGGRDAALVAALRARGRPPALLWLAVAGGEVELAAGLDDEATIAVLRRPPAAVGGGGPGRRVRALARRARPGGRTTERCGALLAAGEAPRGAGIAPPAYVRAIAAAATTPVDGCRVGLMAPSDYPSRKAVMLLFPGEADEPRWVVKLTRDAAFNDRLENEWRALTVLAGAGIGDGATVPRPAFLGHHAGLAVLGETALHGVAFRRRTTGDADCPFARAATDWLLALGAATVARRATTTEVAGALRRLLARFAELYRVTDAEHALLADQVEALAAGAHALPLVMQHGDPGTWNVLVTPDGRPAFLDWEAAERHGMPLWDLFYFARSFGVTVARAAGTRSSLTAFAEQYLADSPLSRRLAADVERHCADIGLDRGLVGPLFHLCWVHRALKEAMRLPPGELERGRYIRLLRLCIDRRDAPALRRLFGGGPA